MMRLCEGHYDKSRASKQQMLSAFKTTYAVSHLVNNGNMDQVNKTLQQLLSSDRLVGIMKILSDRISTEDILYSADNMDTDLDSDASGFCIRASNGDAVAVASTLNSVFGSGVMSRYTGILLNNQMDKFVLADNVTHENGSNTIKLKQEVVSVAPTIILSSHGDLELVLSGGGGRYTSADTAYVAINRLILRRHLRSSIAQTRHHVLPFTDIVAHERRSPKDETGALKKHDANVSEAYSFRTGVIGVANTTSNQYVVSLDRRRSTEFDVI
ncbi:scoloptoxin SSD20-like [Schistocerca nitens]|uniref:scoloptoxin SSD20-like n=1 Tax=Schistocerca nitens TaxID=7011 RepID=UPI002118A172|nr:scoloptoxin SSD20-like [Schistocerca nitens]